MASGYCKKQCHGAAGQWWSQELGTDHLSSPSRDIWLTMCLGQTVLFSFTCRFNGLWVQAQGVTMQSSLGYQCQEPVGCDIGLIPLGTLTESSNLDLLDKLPLGQSFPVLRLSILSIWWWLHILSPTWPLQSLLIDLSNLLHPKLKC